MRHGTDQLTDAGTRRPGGDCRGECRRRPGGDGGARRWPTPSPIAREKLSVIPQRELERVALLHGLGIVTPGQVEAELPRQGGLIIEAIDGRRDGDHGKAAGGRGRDRPIRGRRTRGRSKPVGVPDGLSRQLAGGKRLNDGQWEAVQGLLNSSNLVNLVEGPAGAGKSSLLAKYDEGMRLAGQEVHYFATTAKAAEVLQEDGFEDTQTVAHLLMNEKLQAAMRGSRVVVDEVSMLGHKDAVKLFELARKNDLKLILVGDPLQHGAVARGAIMRVLKDYACIKPFRLTEILRQETAGLPGGGQAAVRRPDAGRAGSHRAAGLGPGNERRRPLFAYRGRLPAGFGRSESRPGKQAGAGRVADARRGGQDHRQRYARSCGTPGSSGEDQPLDPAGAGRYQRGRAGPGGHLPAGRCARVPPERQRLQERRAADRERSGGGAAVAKRQNSPLYRPEAIALAAGDRIRFTGTVKTLDGGHTLKNGMAQAVAGFTGGRQYPAR